MTKADLEKEVGRFLGFGRNPVDWTDDQADVVASCIKAGLSNFYFPPPLPGESSSYSWSFLKPTASVVLRTGASTVDLPDDFGAIEGMLTLSATSTQSAVPVEVTGETRVRYYYQESPAATGRPQAAAVIPVKRVTQTEGQRCQIYVFPIADADYTLTFEYHILPDALIDLRPFHWGGALHSETIKESCLACAEQLFDDDASVHSLKFQERLAASVNADRKLKPRMIGYCGDNSDRQRMSRFDMRGFSRPTVQGVEY